MASELFVDKIYPGPGSTSIELSATDSISFKTSGSTQLTIDSAGRLLTPNRPYFYARGANAFTTAAGTIPYTLVDHNIGGHYDSSTRTFTAPISGLYSITFQFFSAPNNSGTADLQVNGVLTMRVGRENTEVYYEAESNSINKYLNVGDQVRVYWVGGSVHTNTPFSHFSAYLVG